MLLRSRCKSARGQVLTSHMTLLRYTRTSLRLETTFNKQFRRNRSLCHMNCIFIKSRGLWYKSEVLIVLAYNYVMRQNNKYFGSAFCHVYFFGGKLDTFLLFQTRRVTSWPLIVGQSEYNASFEHTPLRGFAPDGVVLNSIR